jgi:hypothetical protein
MIGLLTTKAMAMKRRKRMRKFMNEIAAMA